MRWYLRPEERLPQPPVPVADSRIPVAVGIGVWALLLVLGLFLREPLEHDGRGWWIWVPVAGVALGLIGLSTIRGRPMQPIVEPPRGESPPEPPVSG